MVGRIWSDARDVAAVLEAQPCVVFTIQQGKKTGTRV